MTRNNKDNFLVLILFLISISMIITICSSDSVAIEPSEQTVVQANFITGQNFSTKKVDIIGVKKIIKPDLFQIIKN